MGAPVKILLHIVLAGAMVWWEAAGTDPIVCLAIYSLGLAVLGPPRKSV